MYVYSSQCGGDPGDIGPTTGEQLKRDPFGTVIQSNVLSSMCLSITSQEDPYNRLWCVYELATFLKIHPDGPSRIDFMPNWLPVPSGNDLSQNGYGNQRFWLNYRAT